MASTQRAKQLQGLTLLLLSFVPLLGYDLSYIPLFNKLLSTNGVLFVVLNIAFYISALFLLFYALGPTKLGLIKRKRSAVKMAFVLVGLGYITLLFPGIYADRTLLFQSYWLTVWVYLSLAVAVLVVLLLYSVVKGFRIRDKSNLVLLVTVTILSLIVAEYVVFKMSPYISEYERDGGHLLPMSFTSSATERHMVYQPFEEVVKANSEFNYTHTTNSVGLMDIEPTEIKTEQKRILCLGDSFTEGMGVEPDYSWVKAMMRKLNQQGKNVFAYNAGIADSDPIYQIALAEDILLESIKPDLVIMMVNSSDIHNIIDRGGSERFSEEEMAKSSFSIFGAIQEVSYIVRHLTITIGGLNLAPKQQRTLVAEQILRKEIGAFEKHLKTKQIPFALIVHPVEIEINNNAFVWSDWKVILKQHKYALSLLDRYDKDGFITSQNASEYYYPLDRHHNKAGYELMGRTVADWLLEQEITPL